MSQITLTPEDASLEAAAQREAQEETGLAIPLDLFQQVHTFEDFEDPRGKYVCLLYVLSKPLGAEALIEAGDDASHVQLTICRRFPISLLTGSVRTEITEKLAGSG